MPRLKILTMVDVEEVSHALAAETMAWSEPIPHFDTRYPGTLESCLRTPFQTFSKQMLYKGLLPKAAVLFYLMIKNHPFQNGNKRIAVTTLFVFLYKNGKWLSVDNQQLYNFAKWIAASESTVKDATVEAIKKFLQVHLVELKKF